MGKIPLGRTMREGRRTKMLQKMRRLNTSLPRRRDRDAADRHQGVGLEVVGAVGRELHSRKGVGKVQLERDRT